MKEGFEVFDRITFDSETLAGEFSRSRWNVFRSRVVRILVDDV